MKQTFIALLLCFFTSSLFAQQTPDYGFRLGLTAHPTFGWVKPQQGKSNSVSLGFSYGLVGDFNFAENYSFATGLTITTINGKSTEIVTTPGDPASQAPYELKYRLQYLEVPLTVKLKTSKIGDVRWYGQFGLSNDFNIGAKQNADLAGKEVFRNENISKSINFYRAGLILGAGGEFDLDGHTSLFGGISYNNGFTDITSDKNTNVRNHYIGINLGVFF